MASDETTPPKVFISYSQDSPQHEDRVLELSDRLRADGIDCILDQYEVSPSEGWPRWMDRQIQEADFVLMICTPIYYRRVIGQEQPGTGLGVRWEGNLIYQHIYNAGTLNTKFIPILFEGANISDIPTPYQGTSRYRPFIQDDYKKLYRHLTNQPSTPKPELGKRRTMPPRERRHNILVVTASTDDERDLQRQLADEREARGRANQSTTSLPPSYKIDKNFFVRFNLDPQLAKFFALLENKYKGMFAYSVSSLSGDILREYIIERMLLALKERNSRYPNCYDIVLNVHDLKGGEQFIERKILSQLKLNQITDLFVDKVRTDVILVIWHNAFLTRLVRTPALSFCKVTAQVRWRLAKRCQTQ